MLRNRSDPAGILTATWAKKAQLSSLVKNGLAVTASSLLSAVQILKTMPTDTDIENAWKQARLKHQTDGIIPQWADVIAWSELHRSTPYNNTWDYLPNTICPLTLDFPARLLTLSWIVALKNVAASKRSCNRYRTALVVENQQRGQSY